ncbi:MAG: hypothetical protein RLZZ155_113 [Bacteroidota bacterium]|jgi:hypothetical protein
MKFVEKIKLSAGRRALGKLVEPRRQRAGSNFHDAQSVGILYVDSDERYFNKIKAFAKYLKDKFGVRHIKCVGFVNEPSKNLPIWQSQKLEFEYFTKDDLNWYLRPVQNVSKFIKEDFDILIDLTNGDHIPLNFIFKESKAKMKVGLRDSLAARQCDLMIDLGENPTIDKYLQNLDVYLSNPQIK